MNALTIQQLFANNKKTNFCITTNIGVGRGINGISFTRFFGLRYVMKNNRYRKEKDTDIYEIEETKIESIDVVGNTITFEFYNTDNYITMGNKVNMTLDCNSIVCIEFFTADNGVFCTEMGCKTNNFVPKKLGRIKLTPSQIKL